MVPKVYDINSGGIEMLLSVIKNHALGHFLHHRISDRFSFCVSRHPFDNKNGYDKDLAISTPIPWSVNLWKTVVYQFVHDEWVQVSCKTHYWDPWLVV